jgi:hypothetical protein
MPLPEGIVGQDTAQHIGWQRPSRRCPDGTAEVVDVDDRHARAKRALQPSAQHRGRAGLQRGEEQVLERRATPVQVAGQRSGRTGRARRVVG